MFHILIKIHTLMSNCFHSLFEMICLRKITLSSLYTCRKSPNLSKQLSFSDIISINLFKHCVVRALSGLTSAKASFQTKQDSLSCASFRSGSNLNAAIVTRKWQISFSKPKIFVMSWQFSADRAFLSCNNAKE